MESAENPSNVKVDEVPSFADESLDYVAIWRDKESSDDDTILWSRVLNKVEMNTI